MMVVRGGVGGEIYIKQYVCVLEGGGGVYEIFFEEGVN